MQRSKPHVDKLNRETEKEPPLGQQLESTNFVLEMAKKRLRHANEEVQWAREKLAKDTTVLEYDARVKEAEERMGTAKTELGPELPTVPVTTGQELETLLQQVLENRDTATATSRQATPDQKGIPTEVAPEEKEAVPQTTRARAEENQSLPQGNPSTIVAP